MLNELGRITFRFGLDNDGQFIWEVERDDVDDAQAYQALRPYSLFLEQRLVEAIEYMDDDDPDA